jgi:type I restriction enzyme S subunit
MGLGKIVVYHVDVAINQDLKALFIKEDYDQNYIVHWFNLSSEIIEALGTGSTVKGIRLEQLKNITIYLPKNKEEQTAIAQILTDMDNEIAQLEKERDKYVRLKAGMIQVLLTGKVRLVNSNAGRNSKKVSIQKAISKTHNQPFEDAALIAAIVNSFYSDKYNLGRKKVQKLLYLLRRKQEASVVAFKRKAAGPYAHEIRYKGGERIAKNNGYVTEISNMKGSIFSKGKNIEEALEYISKWEMQQDIDWLISQFKFTPVDQLEVLTTVDMAICDLEKEEKLVSLKSIKDLISSDKEWKDKLNKPYFNDISIQNAIMQSQELFS